MWPLSTHGGPAGSQVEGPWVPGWLCDRLPLSTHSGLSTSKKAPPLGESPHTGLVSPHTTAPLGSLPPDHRCAQLRSQLPPACLWALRDLGLTVLWLEWPGPGNSGQRAAGSADPGGSPAARRAQRTRACPAHGGVLLPSTATAASHPTLRKGPHHCQAPCGPPGLSVSQGRAWACPPAHLANSDLPPRRWCQRCDQGVHTTASVPTQDVSRASSTSDRLCASER